MLGQRKFFFYKVEWGFADNLFFINSFFKLLFDGDSDYAVKNYPIFENVEKAH